MSGLSESAIVRTLAEEVCQRVARRTIANLRRIDVPLLSGDDSILRNMWEEICVQVQREESLVFEDVYNETVRTVVAGYVAELPRHQQDAIWLQTPEAEDWTLTEPEERQPHPVCDDHIIGYIVSNYIYAMAGEWSNRRIRAYLEDMNRRD